MDKWGTQPSVPPTTAALLCTQQTLLPWLIWKMWMWSHRTQPAAPLAPHLRAVLQYPPKFNRVPANCTAVPGSAGRTGLHFCPDKTPHLSSPVYVHRISQAFLGRAGQHCSFPKQKLSLGREQQQEGRAAVSQNSPNLPITLLSLELWVPAWSSTGGTHISAQRPEAKPDLGPKSHVPPSAHEMSCGTVTPQPGAAAESGFVCSNFWHTERTRLQERLWKNWPKYLF